MFKTILKFIAKMSAAVATGAATAYVAEELDKTIADAEATKIRKILLTSALFAGGLTSMAIGVSALVDLVPPAPLMTIKFIPIEPGTAIGDLASATIN